MKTVGQILASKSDRLVTVESDSAVIDALGLMARFEIGTLPVVSDGQLVGLLSERDYARKIVLMGRTSLDTPVSQIMTDAVVCIDRGHSLARCMELMTEHRIRYLPVLESYELVGIISVGDLVKAIMEDQQYQIEQLELYIRS